MERVDRGGRWPRLIATDLDGTLLRDDGTVSPRTDAALRRIAGGGVVVVLVTGRPPRIVRDRLGDWLASAGRHLHEMVICANGALVWDPVADTIIRDWSLAPETANRILDTVRAHIPGLTYSLEAGLDWTHRPDGPDPITRPVNKLLLHDATSSLDELLLQARAAAGAEAEATISGPNWVEVSAAGATKAAALAELAAELGIEPADVVAFGDMPNDLPMLVWAGHGVAVANAHDSVLAAADEVTASNQDDGVALVLERLAGASTPPAPAASAQPQSCLDRGGPADS
jgi:HAD superfamily hydrolase (TIGR01484 family)